MGRWGPLVVLMAAAVAVFGLGLHEAWVDSPTFDEPVYVAAGLGAVLHHDLTFNDEHPILPKVVAVLPVLFAHPVIPPNGHWDRNDERTYSAEFARAQLHAGTLRAVTMASRLTTLLETLGLAFVLYALGRELFGRQAGALAGLLWLLSPFVLGLSHLLSLDVSFALAVGAWSWALLRWSRRPTTGWAVAVGLMSALCVLTDVTGLILAGVSVVAVVAILRRRSPATAWRQGGLVALVVWGSVWVLYAALDPAVLLHPTVILPLPYLEGIRYLAANDTIPGPGYLLGVAWTGGRWWYWPGALLVKTVPTTLVVLVVGPWGLVAATRGTRRPRGTGTRTADPHPGGIHRGAPSRHRASLPAPCGCPVAGGGIVDRAGDPDRVDASGLRGGVGHGGHRRRDRIGTGLTGLDHSPVHPLVPGGHQLRR